MEIVLTGLVGLLVGWFAGRRWGVVAPAFTPEDDESVSASSAALAQRTKKRHARIMEKAWADGRITNDGVEDLFCISDRTASVYLRQLVDTGKLTRHGAGRGTYYTPNPAE